MKVITLALMASLMAVAVCGCASAEAEDVGPAEEAVEETAGETAEESVKAYAEWTVKDITEFKEIVSGVTNRQYAAGEGANYIIYEDISYDGEIVENVQFNTASVRFDTIGEYGMTYWVYFNLPALTGWMAENGVDTALDGLDSDADVLCVKVGATLLVTEGNPWTKDAEEEDAEDETAAVSASAGTTTATTGSGASTKSGSGSSKSNGNSSSKSNNDSSKSNSSSSSKSNTSSETECDHDWVEVEVYNVWVCKVCGYTVPTSEGSEGLNKMSAHFSAEHDHRSGYTLKTIHNYKCSKCGATK